MSHGTPVQCVPTEHSCQPALPRGSSCREWPRQRPGSTLSNTARSSPVRWTLQSLLNPDTSLSPQPLPPSGLPSPSSSPGLHGRIPATSHTSCTAPHPSSTCDQRDLPKIHIQLYSPAPSQPEEPSWREGKGTSALRLPGSCPPALS